MNTDRNAKIALPGCRQDSKGRTAVSARLRLGAAGTFLIALAALCVLMLPGSDSRAEAGGRRYARTLEVYTIPDVVLVNQDGHKVHLRTLLSSEKPVVVDFIFGTCTTICPVLSAGFANLQKTLGPDSHKVHLVSISIDPENDTPKVTKEYLKRYGARPGWDFLTGTRGNIDAVTKAFNAYVYNKMSHDLLTFIRAPREGKWVRIRGMMSAAEFTAECREAGIL